MRTDGNLPLVDLSCTKVENHTPPEAVLRASLGYPIPTDEGGTALPDPNHLSVENIDPSGSLVRRPIGVWIASFLGLAFAIFGVVGVHRIMPAVVSELAAKGEPPDSLNIVTGGAETIFLIAFALVALLAVLTFFRHTRSRLVFMGVTAGIAVATEIMRLSGSPDWNLSRAGYVELVATVLVLLTLTTQACSQWSRLPHKRNTKLI